MVAITTMAAYKSNQIMGIGEFIDYLNLFIRYFFVSVRSK
jgi:hypothetical protein